MTAIDDRRSPLMPVGKDVLQAYEHEITEFAKQYLGRGYDRSKNPNDRLLDDVLEIEKAKIEVRSAKSLEAYHVACTTEAAVEELKNKFSLNFNFGNQTVSLASSFSYQSGSESSENKTKVVYLTTYVNYNEVRFRGIPQVNPEIPLHDYRRLGDGFVTSLWAYTGYKVLVEMTVESDQESNNSEWHAGVTLGVGNWQLGASFDRLSNNLQSRTVSNIILHRYPFGNFPLDHVPMHLRSLEEVDFQMQLIRREYLHYMYQITRPAHWIDENNLGRYGDIPPPLRRPIINPSPHPDVDPSPPPSPIRPNPTVVNFHQLSLNIANTFDKRNIAQFKYLLKGLEYSRILEGMQTIFAPVFARKENITQMIGVTCSLIVGKAGQGKSTLVGCMNGAIYRKQRITIPSPYSDRVSYKTVLEPNVDETVRDRLPPTGYLTAVTRGYNVYRGEIRGHNLDRGYIDTAGLVDSGGSEFDICNAMAIEMAARIFSPRRLIVVLDPNLLSTRCGSLKQFMDGLARVVQNSQSSKGKGWESILFVANDPNNPTPKTLEALLEDIETAIITLETEIADLIPEKKSFLRWLLGSAKPTKLDQMTSDEIDEIDPVKYADIMKKMETLEILKKISKENLIVADFCSETTRGAIDKWELEHKDGRPLAFNVANFVYNGKTIFNTVLSHVAGYFLSRLTRQRDLERLINVYLAKIRIINSDIVNLCKRAEIVDVKEREGSIDQQIDDYKERINRFRSEIAALEIELQAQVTARIIKEDEEAFVNVPSNEAITSRSWWAWGKMAKEYRFVHDGLLPIIRKPKEEMHVMVAKEGKTYPLSGSYFNRDKSQLQEGKYAVSFVPAWHGYDGDEDAGVRVCLKKKDHPEYVAEIQALKDKEEGLRIAIENKQHELSLEMIHCENSESSKKSTGEERAKIEEQIKKQLESEKRHFEGLLSTAEGELSEIRVELTTYKDYCGLIRNIIHGLGFDELSNDSESETYREFYINFNEETFSAESSSSSSSSNSSFTSKSSSSSSSSSSFFQ